MIESIQTYLKHGFNCIPVNQDKTPACDWKHFQSNKITDLKLFTTESIALICGKISDNLEVLDFDNHNNTATENLKQYIENPLIKEIYDKYKLPIIQTQGGGFHIYFRCDKIEGNQKLASILLNGKPDAIIESRGEGGYVLAPPTKGYKIIRNDFKDLQFITENERIILLEVAKSFNEYIQPTQKYKSNYFSTDSEGDRPGKIYDADINSKHAAENILKNAGWVHVYNHAWRRPGKNKGISATFGQVADNVLYVFTSNSEHFENNKAYTPFQIKALIEYNGNFSECAKDLAKRFGLNKPKEKKKDNQLIDKIYKESKIDFNKEYKFPPYCIWIKNGTKLSNIGSLGNFSAITGKSKARKSFARFFFEAAALSQSWIDHKFYVKLPNNKKNVIYIDTEQGISNVAFAGYRIVKMANISNYDHYQVFALRNYSYSERCNAIEEIIKKTKNLGIVFIDGIADLAFGNNDELEANRVVQLLMNWTANYHIHICTVIHQPKSADWATGHLGSAIEKKAETVINVKKDGNYSIIESKQLRGSEDFAPFPFLIEDNIPQIIDENSEITEKLWTDEI